MKKPAGDGTAIIKKYANRRLYNTETSSYITLDHLAAMTRAGRDFKVVDARTDEDITRSVLTQIIMDEESRGETMLPVNFLRQIIGMYGDSMGAMVPGYLEASMNSFRHNQAQFTSVVEDAFAGSPFADLAKRNLAMFEAAAQAFKVPAAAASAAGAGAGAGAGAPAAASRSGEGSASKDEEIASLRAEIARLQDAVNKVAGAPDPAA